ncbi:MAG: YdeI/OmpD-associated family protein [Pseudomonadota bacterium]
MFLPYRFRARIDAIDYGRMVYGVVFLPQALTEKLPFDTQPRLRVIAEISTETSGQTVTDHPAALLPEARGRYLLLSKKLLGRLNAEIGDEVEVAFDLDDPNRVDIPPVLVDALADEPDLNKAWRALTPGRQRGLAYRIAQAKTEPTRMKRLDELRMELLG